MALGLMLALPGLVFTGTGITTPNLLVKTQLFDDAAWTKDGSTITANATTDPFGAMDADKLIESATTAEHRIFQRIAVSPGSVMGNPYSWTIYAKAVERHWISIRNSGASLVANFDLTNGVVGTVKAGTTASLSSAGSGWYRCRMSGNANDTQEYMTVNIGDADTGTGISYSYTGNGTSGIYIFGAQLQSGATPGAYQAVG